VTLKYRALAVSLADEDLWFWIGEHDVYDGILSYLRFPLPSGLVYPSRRGRVSGQSA
jgi:hypothetical protein